MGEMRTLGREGDVKHIWDPAVPAEVEAARATFDRMTRSGHLAFKVTDGKGKKGEQIRTFDPAAGKIILAPPMAGG